MCLLETILTKCDERYSRHINQCYGCTYGEYCPHDCEKCLEYIHFPEKRPNGAPLRKYDCVYMADVYTCKYSCRYTSELVYELRYCRDLQTKNKLKVLSLGCGPCTDLFAIEYLRSNGEYHFEELDYIGVDYSEDVWQFVHNDIKAFQTDKVKIHFEYDDICSEIHDIARDSWRPDLIVFQYVFSDMQKHSGEERITAFIDAFADYYNDKVEPKTYVLLNDINLGNCLGGGRDYFDQLREKLQIKSSMKAHYRNSVRNREYPYGVQMETNSNLFDIQRWRRYSPFDTCASALMLIKKELR